MSDVMGALNAKLKGAVDIQKIQDLTKEKLTHILVGFPSGRQHTPAVHEGDEKKDIEFIETAELAKMLSYGTADIPARPFLEEGLNDQRERLKNALEKEAKKLVNFKQPNWNKVGSMAVGAIQDFVRSDYYKTNIPNSKATIERKTVNGKVGDIPLIDSGDMINSLSFIVEKE